MHMPLAALLLSSTPKTSNTELKIECRERSGCNDPAIADHSRVDRFLNDVRANQKASRNYGRWMYLAAVIGVFGYLMNLVIGPFLWLKAEGLVVSDHVVVASPYDVQIKKMVVQSGQLVKKGDVLAEVHSPQVAEATATLTARAAETAARQADLAIRYEVANTVMKSAEERLLSAETLLRKVSSARNGTGFVSDLYLASVQRDRYTAMQEKASRDAERRATEKQLTQLAKSQAEAREALQKLRATYNDGIVLAPAEGIVGQKQTVQGEVIKPGDYLMKIHTGVKYALVYLETGTLYDVAVGDRVEVADGFKSSVGYVVEIAPLTVQLPTEFQKAFRPPTRGQIAKITLDDPSVFPLDSKVTVIGDKLLPGNAQITRSYIYGSLHEMLSSAYGWGKDISVRAYAKVKDVGKSPYAHIAERVHLGSAKAPSNNRVGR